MQLKLGEIAGLLKSAAPGADAAAVTGYSIDSRTLRAGDLFFAIRGQKLDGHDYVARALAAGAAGAVVESSRVADFPAEAQSRLVTVPDTLEALQSLAASVRRRWGGPIVAVTGSTGKTTTKQMIAALLGTRFRVMQSEGNLNNQYGLPLCLLRLEPETEMGVFEMGMSAPGEIRLLAGIAAPDVAVVTNISAVHLEFFRDVDAIARAKYELIEALGVEGWAVLNADDERARAFGEKMTGRVLYYGVSHPAHFQAQELAPNGNGGFAFTLPAKAFESVRIGSARGARRAARGSDGSSAVRFHLPLLGRHNVLNALASLAVCYSFGIPPESLREAVETLRPASMRGEMVRLASGALAVNDCYNSSPGALESMLAAVAGLPARRRFAVLGGMMELGPTSESLHRRCGSRAAELGFDGLFTVGDPARAIADGARESGMRAEAAVHFDSPQQAAARLNETLQEGDVVLIKASRAVHLERVWEVLKKVTSD